MEIKPQELRIGNLISSNVNGRNLITVLQLFSDSYQADFGNGQRGAMMYSTAEGIELTPEWFKRSGFKEYEYSKEALLISGSDTYVKTYTLGKLTICDWGDGKFILTNAFNFDLRVEIKTLHHLQNIVYSLTGEELAIDKQISNGN